MGIYWSVWGKYARFSGRATRKEYWIWSSVNNIALLLIAFQVAGVLPDPAMLLGLLLMLFLPTIAVAVLLIAYSPLEGQDVAWGFTLLGVSLLLLLPAAALTARRLHDSDNSAWWALCYFVPWAGWFVVTMFAALLKSTPGDNEHGPNPYGENPPA